MGLGEEDSNLHYLGQNQAGCHYPIPQGEARA